MSKNRRKTIGIRRVEHMLMERRALLAQRARLVQLQEKLKDGTAKVVDGQIVTVPRKHWKGQEDK